ncbi:isocitrate lyase/phosphoenolpyruvate mutase family protein [Amycolatopsis sp. FBCC-B4732]|uniref:isocitrate lyase/PEP mutase family protein n=1 Tax=Amycolatopsis sp. FBCC-B4732 TaxID=3079339 RepID=UPI001FF43633|nr:isocitrate lyase/phosphoenolpyruvate mutase family protein [Amycolatopsis sp. FBCC-B4732]UOX89027.1 isocitrate lyase/phosphoenolpyruvate mutase family protein [Amycolatopsis sp. FBCC-B4732]
MTDLKAHADLLRELHHGDLLVLPNAWDEASAELVVETGFPVVATSSAAVADVLGFQDGEAAPWREMFAAAARIARAVGVPVTVDAEAGYGLAPGELVDRLLEAGAAGCNLEDTDHRAGGLADAEAHADWLAEVRAAADASGVPLVVNARIDVFLPPAGVPEADRVAAAVRRARGYREAGADCVYPIGAPGDALARVVAEVPGPVNGNTNPALDLAGLAALGVARVSYGPRFHRSGFAGMREALVAIHERGVRDVS